MEVIVMAALAVVYIVLLLALAMVRSDDLDYEDEETWESHNERY